MGWYLDTTRIYVISLEQTIKQIIPRLQPLANGTVIQIFGYDEIIYQVTCKVVGDTNLASVQGMAATGLSYSFTGNDSFSATVVVSSVNAKRDEYAYQTIDTAQDCTTPVYTLTMELYAV